MQQENKRPTGCEVHRAWKCLFTSIFSMGDFDP